jgi:lipopolysaccharide export system permease protein
VRRLNFYLSRTVAGAMIAASLGLIALFVLFTFLDQLEDIKNDYTMFTAFTYVTYSIPRIFYETLPYAVLIGCLVGLGILANNSELIVIRAAGISTWQIAWAAMRPALILVAIGLIIGELVLPDFERTGRVIREQAMEDDITPQGGFWYREGNIYMHFNSISHTGEIRNINEYIEGPDQSLQSIRWIEKASYVESPESPEGSYWLLENIVVTRVTGGPVSEEHLDTDRWHTQLTPSLLNTEILVEPDRMSIYELNQKISYMRSQGLNSGKFELGFWTKVFQPVASLSLVFIAISFIFGPLRETTMGMRVVSGLVIGILFKFIQDLLSPASLVFGFSPLVATLVPILICLGAGYYLLKRAG